MNRQKPKIFLSYTREDMGMAKKLYNDLKRYELAVWLETESLLPGDRWKDKIQEAIEHINVIIALSFKMRRSRSRIFFMFAE